MRQRTRVVYEQTVHEPKPRSLWADSQRAAAELSMSRQSTSRSWVVYEQTVHEPQPSWLSFMDNKGELFNCFSINQQVGQNIILKKTETSAKREFSSGLSRIDSRE